MANRQHGAGAGRLQQRPRGSDLQAAPNNQGAGNAFDVIIKKGKRRRLASAERWAAIARAP
eukprot:912592-Alexandrium_andersonii.AAC.1